MRCKLGFRAKNHHGFFSFLSFFLFFNCSSTAAPPTWSSALCSAASYMCFPWAAAGKALLPPARHLCPWGFSRQQYWNGLHSLLQGIFLTQESNPYLLHWQGDCLPLSHQGSPITNETPLFSCQSLFSLESDLFCMQANHKTVCT